METLANLADFPAVITLGATFVRASKLVQFSGSIDEEPTGRKEAPTFRDRRLMRPCVRCWAVRRQLRGRGNTKNGGRIIGELGIGSQQSCSCHDALRDQDAVEWILVQRRQALQPEDMGQLDWEKYHGVDGLLFCDELIEGAAEGELAQLVLDLYFPDASHAEQQSVFQVLAYFSSFSREPVGA